MKTCRYWLGDTSGYEFCQKDGRMVTCSGLTCNCKFLGRQVVGKVVSRIYSMGREWTVKP